MSDMKLESNLPEPTLEPEVPVIADTPEEDTSTEPKNDLRLNGIHLALGICDADARDAIVDILNKFALPVSCAYSAENLYLAALSDKKRSGGMVNLIIPERIGCCRIVPTPVGELQSFIKAGL